MEEYLKPDLVSLDAVSIKEHVGPIQAASAQMTFEGWRGSFLNDVKDYKYCEVNEYQNRDFIYKYENKTIKRG